MAKKLDRPFARYDAQFWQDDRYMAMPKAIRNHAYLYMLAIVGYCRAKRSRGVVSKAVADGLARFLELPANRVQEALVEVGLLLWDGFDEFEVPKYDKWQDTPEEIAELSETRASAGSRGGAHPKQTASNEQAKREQKGSKGSGEREREVEREVVTPLPLPPPQGLDTYRSNETHHVSESIGDVVARMRAKR